MTQSTINRTPVCLRADVDHVRIDALLSNFLLERVSVRAPTGRRGGSSPRDDHTRVKIASRFSFLVLLLIISQKVDGIRVSYPGYWRRTKASEIQRDEVEMMQR